VIAAFQNFHARHGRSPSQTSRRSGAIDLPSRATVVRHFGTWSAAVDAAGLPQNMPGRPRGSARSAAPADTPTAWYCPSCKTAIEEMECACEGRPAQHWIEVPLLPPGLPLADLAVILRPGYNVVPEYWHPSSEMELRALVVAAKEPSNG
jgi:hypothetical protein